MLYYSFIVMIVFILFVYQGANVDSTFNYVEDATAVIRESFLLSS